MLIFYPALFPYYIILEILQMGMLTEASATAGQTLRLSLNLNPLSFNQCYSHSFQ